MQRKKPRRKLQRLSGDNSRRCTESKKSMKRKRRTEEEEEQRQEQAQEEESSAWMAGFNSAELQIIFNQHLATKEATNETIPPMVLQAFRAARAATPALAA